MIPDGSLNIDVAGILWRYIKREGFQSLTVMQSAHHSQNNITTIPTVVNRAYGKISETPALRSSPAVE